MQQDTMESRNKYIKVFKNKNKNTLITIVTLSLILKTGHCNPKHLKKD